MHIDIFLVDGAYILFVVVGFCLMTGLQCGITSNYVHRLSKKVGPDYWGSVYGTPGESDCEPTIPLNKPAREMQSNYGRSS
jgi:hypothetical protein